MSPELIQAGAFALISAGTALMIKATATLHDAKEVYTQISRAVSDLRDEVQDLRAEVRELRECNEKVDHQIALLERRVQANSSRLQSYVEA